MRVAHHGLRLRLDSRVGGGPEPGVLDLGLGRVVVDEVLAEVEGGLADLHELGDDSELPRHTGVRPQQQRGDARTAPRREIKTNGSPSEHSVSHCTVLVLAHLWAARARCKRLSAPALRQPWKSATLNRTAGDPGAT
eukprot:CAMPEP_0180147812 /NCGR_PEP_ID=MMETSP0986-20121125/19543_1 /TAXON_ID=697907 /ORGANISM="non described non described, Strain CCMP2293" /LENGTH=136 /DNA_ID=CAMNT_0022093561 /DNA_START=901 /DNA_END=1307 /DNA_ORIENTATION=+